ncbi:MAG: NADH:flavin oxidoreductase/NADH oxidase [Parvibaculaceae bacterium]
MTTVKSSEADAAYSPVVQAEPLLLQPISLRGSTARNRIVLSPMSQYASIEGGPTDWHLAHFGKFSAGGAGIVFSEDTAIEADGRGTPGCAGLYTSEHVRQYRRITDFIKAQGAIPAIQLGHTGAKAGAKAPWADFDQASLGALAKRRISPSAVRLENDGYEPRAILTGEIPGVLELWRDAAARAVDAGYDICEVHSAHGYLLHQFLSPLTNRRTDSYGGGLRGRMRFPLEVVETVRRVWPDDRPLFVRISAVDGSNSGWTLDDSVEFARELAARGVDVVDCSSGGLSGQLTSGPVQRKPGYQVEFAERIRRDAKVRTMAVGLITEPGQAETVLRSGQADLVALGREMVLDPNWPTRAASTLGSIDPFQFISPSYAWWLRRREELRNLGPKGDAPVSRS